VQGADPYGIQLSKHDWNSQTVNIFKRTAVMRMIQIEMGMQGPLLSLNTAGQERHVKSGLIPAEVPPDPLACPPR